MGLCPYVFKQLELFTNYKDLKTWLGPEPFPWVFIFWSLASFLFLNAVSTDRSGDVPAIYTYVYLYTPGRVIYEVFAPGGKRPRKNS